MSAIFAGIFGVGAQNVTEPYSVTDGDNGYTPLLKEGKIWIWNGLECYGEKVYEFPIFNEVKYKMEIEGKKLFVVSQTSVCDLYDDNDYLLYEENGKVEIRYEYGDGAVKYYPLYDFNMKPGDKLPVVEVIEGRVLDQGDELEMIARTDIEAHGKVWRRMELKNTRTNKSVFWVEGIGAPHYMQMQSIIYPDSWDCGIDMGGFRECIDNGETIFTMSDFGETLSVDALPSETEAIQRDAPIYDMLGRRVTSMARGGIYVRDGKKFVYLSHKSE